MPPKLLPLIALIASLMLASHARAEADGGGINSKIYNGKEYRLTAPPPEADLAQARPSVDQLRKYYASCYRNGSSFGTPNSMILRPGQNTLWHGWYCPSNKPDPKPTPTPDDPDKTPNPTPTPPKAAAAW